MIGRECGCSRSNGAASGMQVVSTLKAGDYFGQQALWKTNTPRAATAITKEDCIFYTLERQQFQKLLGPLDQIWRFQALQKVPHLYLPRPPPPQACLPKPTPSCLRPCTPGS